MSTTKEKVFTTDIIAHTVHPVLGEITPDAVGNALGTGFCRFEGPTYAGLARRCGPALDLLAIISHKPGKGKFPEFLEQLKALYSVIRFYEVMNTGLYAHLRSAGFNDFSEWGVNGPNLMWEKPK